MNVRRAFVITYVHACVASNEDFANLCFGTLEDFSVILLRNGEQCN